MNWVERMTAKSLVMAKSSTKFRKRKYSDLEAKAHAVLRYLKLSEEEYQQQQSNTGADREPSLTPLGDNEMFVSTFYTTILIPCLRQYFTNGRSSLVNL